MEEAMRMEEFVLGHIFGQFHQIEPKLPQGTFELSLLKSRILSAHKKLLAGTLSECICGNHIPLVSRDKDPSRLYCDECDKKFSEIASCIFDKITELNVDLLRIDNKVREIMANSEKSVGKDSADGVKPDISLEQRRRETIQANINQCKEILLLISKGEYRGICMDCDEDLPLGRIKIKPFAKRCTVCAENFEKEQARMFRLREN